jgi:hypothetical protein
VIAEFVRTYHEESVAASLHNRVPSAPPRSADWRKPVEKSSALLTACLGASLPQRSSVPARPRWTRSATS